MTKIKMNSFKLIEYYKKFGIIVFIYEGSYSTSEVKELVIIDGQQRITSVVLYLIACRDYLQEKLDQATTEIVEIKKFVKELEDMLISFNGRKILELGNTNEELFENMYDYKEYDAKIKQANSSIQNPGYKIFYLKYSIEKCSMCNGGF